MTREELITWAIANGWKQDRFGHLQKEEHEGLRRYRLKLSRIAARFETKTAHGCYAACGIATAMPNPGLCRMASGEGCRSSE